MEAIYPEDGGIIDKKDFFLRLNNISQELPTVTTNKKIQYYNIPAAFDIEVSSFYIDDEKCACMYCWQMGVWDMVVTGRTWEEFNSFISLLRKVLGLSDTRRLVVYVHNLAYEFQFIRKQIKWDKVFIIEKRKVAYAISDGIEFRCSLKLAGGKSLENVGKDLTKYKVSKAVGNLDYNKLRTPLTPLSEKEWLYCERDIRVLLCYIQEKIEQDGDITRIPLTNTGYVRNFCRKKCMANWKRYHRLMSELTLDPLEYSQLKRAYQGGFVHANAHYVNKVLTHVGSHDFGSSYPAVMLLEKFPMSKSALIEHPTPEEFIHYIVYTNCMFDVTFENLMPRLHQEHPVSFSKCDKFTADVVKMDNGRIVYATTVSTTLTEQDFWTMLEFYTWDSMTVTNLRWYHKQYLPRALAEAILELYEKKTKLKDKVGEEVNYMISKNMINASYGMMVTDPLRDGIDYVEDIFISSTPDVKEALDAYNSNIRRFLFYPWGVWVTAYARANLFSGIVAIGDDYVYSDTDSLKILNPEKHVEYFERYNEEQMAKIEAASKQHRIPVEKFMPKTQKGKAKVIGVWEDEGIYEQFKTLGAKRYMTSKTVRDQFIDDDIEVQLTKLNISTTIAGPNKRLANSYFRSTLTPFESFKHDAEIPKERSGRKLLTYIDDEREGDIVDYLGVPYHFHELSCIHMEDKEYHMSQSEEFIRYLTGLEDISE